MIKKKVENLIIFLAILIALTALISADELSMKITANINDYSTDLHLKTNPNSNSTLEGYDMVAPSSPTNYSTLSSAVASSSLSIDTWDANENPRTVNLTYTVSPGQTGTLNFTWTSPTGYTATFTDYGADSAYSTPVFNLSMNDESSYTASLSGASTSGAGLAADTTRYIQVEISTTPVEAGGGAGGGAAAAGEEAVEVRPDFTISTDLIKVAVKQGESKREVIRIKNTGNIPLDIDIRLEDIEKFMAIDADSFTLNPGDTKVVKLDIFAREEESLDAYIGKIIIMGAGIRKVVNVIIEVKERKPLFDILVEVIKKKVKQGDDVEATMEVINMGDLEYIDILLYYAVKDFKGNIISFKEESLAIKQRLKIPRELKVPRDLPPGDYVFYAKVSFEDVTATGADTFKVVSTEKLLIPISIIWSNKIVLSSLLGLIVIVVILILFIRKKPKLKILYKEKPEKRKPIEKKLLDSKRPKGLEKLKVFQKELKEKIQLKKVPKGKLEVYEQKAEPIKEQEILKPKGK